MNSQKKHEYKIFDVINDCFESVSQYFYKLTISHFSALYANDHKPESKRYCQQNRHICVVDAPTDAAARQFFLALYLSNQAKNFAISQVLNNINNKQLPCSPKVLKSFELTKIQAAKLLRNLRIVDMYNMRQLFHGT